MAKEIEAYCVADCKDRYIGRGAACDTENQHDKGNHSGDYCHCLDGCLAAYHDRMKFCDEVQCK